MNLFTEDLPQIIHKTPDELVNEEHLGRLLELNPNPNRFGSLNDLYNKFKKLIKPKAIYSIVPLQDLKERDQLPDTVKDSEYAAFAVCSIGKQLEEMVSKLQKCEKLYKGYLLDRIGTYSLFMLSFLTAKTIYNRSLKNSHKTTQMIFPGNFRPHWSLRKQKLIFKYIDSNKIGVTLNSDYIMKPKKSISFVMGIGANIEQSENLISCYRCDISGCDFRGEVRIC